MGPRCTPRRRRGVEWLDDPGIDPAVRAASLADVARSNVLFGGRRCAVRAVAGVLRSLGSARATLVDVGTGMADIPAAVAARARQMGVELATVGVDVSPSVLPAARARLNHAACGSALAIPFANRSADLVTASQLLHHFDDDGAVAVIRELDRVAARAVVICDLRRSWVAAAAFWLVSWPLRFHRVTRHDGLVSVLRGFTDSELASIVERATGQRPVVERHAGFRLTATWTVAGARSEGAA